MRCWSSLGTRWRSLTAFEDDFECEWFACRARLRPTARTRSPLCRSLGRELEERKGRGQYKKEEGRRRREEKTEEKEEREKK